MYGGAWCVLCLWWLSLTTWTMLALKVIAEYGCLNLIYVVMSDNLDYAGTEGGCEVYGGACDVVCSWQ